VRRILDLTGVSITVPISESVDEALARVDAGPDLPEEPSV
jgi:stage II sporulation protein AA (anti-sigma F factor antagonist)